MALTRKRKSIDGVYINNHAALPIPNPVVLTYTYVDTLASKDKITTNLIIDLIGFYS